MAFSVTYRLVNVPLYGIIKRFRARYYLALSIVWWSIVSTFLDFTKPFGGLIAARCLFGLLEGDLLVEMDKFYRRHTMLVFLLPQGPLSRRMLVNHRRVRYD